MRQLAQRLIHRRNFRNRTDDETKRELITGSLLESAKDDSSVIGLH